jgi:hypothetical protein
MIRIDITAAALYAISLTHPEGVPRNVRVPTPRPDWNGLCSTI